MTDQPTLPPEGGVGDVVVQEKRRRFSIVWIIPIVVVLVGSWLAYRTIAEKGPTITIGFKTAETLEAGKPPSQVRRHADPERARVQVYRFNPYPIAVISNQTTGDDVPFNLG
jgi:hypothetical protein